MVVVGFGHFDSGICGAKHWCYDGIVGCARTWYFCGRCDDVISFVAKGIGHFDGHHKASIEQEKIDAILSGESSNHTGIGIKNVNDRLKIYFGNQYGITIRSALDEGTTVKIRMPKLLEGSEYETK